jgi:hypothetical protein
MELPRQLDLFLRNYDIDILLATEIKLHSRLNFFIPGYKIYRPDHPDDRANGGSAIFIKQQLEHCEVVATLVSEAQVTRIHMKLGGRDCVVGSFYSAPSNRVQPRHQYLMMPERAKASLYEQ